MEKSEDEAKLKPGEYKRHFLNGDNVKVKHTK